MPQLQTQCLQAVVQNGFGWELKSCTRQEEGQPLGNGGPALKTPLLAPKLCCLLPVSAPLVATPTKGVSLCP